MPSAWRLPRRRNFRGEETPSAAGVRFILPAAALAGMLAAACPEIRRAALIQLAAVAAFAALGLLDDLAGSREFGGIRGHLRALLRHGRVTTGLVKLAVGSAAALALGWLAAPRWQEALLDGALIALAANVVNLLDLRPGRALKAFALGAMVLAPGVGWPGLLPLLALALPAAVYAPLDLKGRAMMGDMGANALGAALGTAAVLHLGLAGRLGILAILAGLQVLSEFVSFSAAIERCRPLRYLDGLGRSV